MKKRTWIEVPFVFSGSIFSELRNYKKKWGIIPLNTFLGYYRNITDIYIFRPLAPLNI